MTLPFDPRLVPKAPLLPDLAAVEPSRLLPHALRSRFAQPPDWRVDPEVDHGFPLREPVRAAVLVPLVVRRDLPQGPWGAAPSVLFTQRAAHLRAHGGQISFPGGRSELADPDAVATALREAHEEIGLRPDRVEVIGQLPDHVTATGFVVTPVVGLVQAQAHESEQLALSSDPREVEDVFEVPLAFLMDPANHERRWVQMGEGGFVFFAMPWRPTQRETDHFIWGATAAMLRNFYRFLSA